MRIDAKGVKSYTLLEISICRWKSPKYCWKSPKCRWGSPKCRWGSPDPQRSNCGFAIHAGQRPAIILPVDLEIHRN